MTRWATDVSRVRVMGLTLREPLTLAHVLLLAEAGSPVLLGGDVLCGDVALAAFVCAWPAHESRKRIQSRLAPLAFRLWPRLIRPTQDDCNAMVGWINENAAMPASWQRPGGAELAAPWWINRIAQAMAAGFSYTEATTLPLRVVNLTIAAKLEASGVIEFQTDRQTQFFENVKRWEAERKN